ncbi:hypothetical protein SAMN04488564_101217 [Lentzea waywayandensis]|uniref:DUF4279 domain-containing protein n=1 Tax=Lentzea waywayandensis TaxID=84724 RepID=A0A1I6CSW4_9PSEU|nr:hypothetical protein [Lentzea waywayandensis]SFQ96173.1 hypothetical protein SAMN04488564_101217 [Lentzea waywayandensis]
MEEEPWSRATLRVWAGEMTVAEIGAALQIDGAERSDRLWCVEPGEGDMHLDDRLKAVEAVLAEHREALVQVAARCDVDLFVSWSPKEGQDSVCLGPDLIRLLGELGAHVVMDTHTG